LSAFAPQRTDRTLTAWRIGDPDGQFPIFSARGSELAPGRWNDPLSPVIYASEHYSTAMLEKLAHGSGVMPPHQHVIQITLPRGVSFEVVTKDTLPEWAAEDGAASAGFGSAWVREKRSLLLLVPSVVARMERNVVINPAHPEFGDIETALPEPIRWDRRLFA
jgi:RES domain-containing protein